MGDPVAEKSAFLKMYMSGHPDTLVAYAKFFGGVKEQIVSAEMSAIDTKTMTLTCTLRDKSTKVVVVPISPPLRGYEDVKPRLLEMKAKAQEGLGMIKTPKISDFRMVPHVYLFMVLAFISFIAGFPDSTLSSSIRAYLPSAATFVASDAVPYSIRALVAQVAPYGGYFQPAGWYFFSVLLGLHIVEAMYTTLLCWWYVDNPITAILYISATIFAGYHVWGDLRRRVMNKRIESVMKVE